MLASLARYGFALLLLSFSSGQAQSLQRGDPAFLPELSDSHGNVVSLADVPAAGQWLVLWFYPQSLSSGCSLQAKRYSDLSADFAALSTRVFGISDEDGASQCEFVRALAEQGQILPDRDSILANAYGVDGLLFTRNTVLVNPKGEVEEIWHNVDPIEDADVVLEYLKSK